MMKLYRICIVATMLAVVVSASFSQTSMKGRLIIRIPEVEVVSMRALFAPVVTTDAHFNPQTCRTKDADAIRTLLGLPSVVNGLSIAPFIPEHNVVLETLREHTNPFLFVRERFGIVTDSEPLRALRQSEDRLSRCFELRFDTSYSVEKLMYDLRKSGRTEYMQPRMIDHTCFIPNDSLFPGQYSAVKMHLEAAWDITRCDSTMLIADDDIGTDWHHKDLKDVIYTNAGEMGLDSLGYDKRSNGIDDDGDGFIDDWHGWDFAGRDGTTSDNDPSTSAAHGTHTGGILAAKGNNVTGICGVAFGAKLLVLKCGDESGSNVAYGYEGMVYAADKGAKVVNNSWGGTGYSQISQDVINYVTAKNCLVVAAAGNDDINENLYPASYDHVLSVGASDEGDNYASFSSFGQHVDVVAPGNNILSTLPSNGYGNMSGTSMATPNAAGVAALVRMKFPDLSPDQVAERIRITTRPLYVPAGDVHEFFTGHGLVSADSALGTSGHHYSVRIVSDSIEDANGDGLLQSGEDANIVLSVRNYLDPIHGLTAKIEFLAPGPDNVVATSSSVNFPDANTLDVVQNISGTFHISVLPNAGTDIVVPVRVTFNAGPDYQGDVDYFSLVINPSYVDLNKNNLTTTISAKGDIGYNDPPDNMQGSGFVWTSAPPEIVAAGRSVLFAAGLMIGTDDVHVVAAAPSAYSDLYTDQDYRVVQPAHYVFEPDHAGALQQVDCIFDDSAQSLDLQDKEVGVRVASHSYEFGGNASNAAIFDYVLSHRDPDNGLAASDATAAALYMDWDIGSSGSNNVASVSPLDSSIAVTRRLEAGYPLVGVKIISPLPEGASTNFYALENDGSNGSIGVYNGYPEDAKWETMITPRSTAGPNDVSMICGVRNLPLASVGSVRITYVIGLGTNDADLKQTIDNATAAWFGTSGVVATAASTTRLRYFPNPCSDVLHLESPFVGAQSVSVVDVLGRRVFSAQSEASQMQFDLSKLTPGMYRLVVTSADKSQSGALLIQ